MTTRTRITPSSIRDWLLEMASRPCGLVQSDISRHYSPPWRQYAHAELRNLLVQQRLLMRVERIERRYFANRDLLMSYTRAAPANLTPSTKGAPAPKLLDLAAPRIVGTSSMRRAGPLTPVVLPGSVLARRRQRLPPDAVAAPAGAPRITRGPDWTHDPRYQVAPGAHVEGAGFARLGPGRYLDDDA